LNIELISIDNNNIFLIKQFLKDVRESRASFRYFENRGYEAIDNHLITYVMKVESNTVAYGHLDKEQDKVWLGICVSDSHHGKGLGNMMMKELLAFARNSGLGQIHLSVDKSNKIAYSLYKKMGFLTERESEKSIFMKKEF